MHPARQQETSKLNRKSSLTERWATHTHTHFLTWLTFCIWPHSGGGWGNPTVMPGCVLTIMSSKCAEQSSRNGMWLYAGSCREGGPKPRLSNADQPIIEPRNNRTSEWIDPLTSTFRDSSWRQESRPPEGVGPQQPGRRDRRPADDRSSLTENPRTLWRSMLKGFGTLEWKYLS